MEFVFISPMSW